MFETLETRRLLATVELAAVADNTLYEDSNGELSNGAGMHFFAGRTNQGSNSIRRGLIKFDIGSEVPSGATIDNVTLSLHMSQTIAAAQDIALHRVLADWGEGTSEAPRGDGPGGGEGRGGEATDGDATWIHRVFDSQLWDEQGGDFAESASATTSVADTGTYTWSSDDMAADVQGWLDDDTPQFGWLLKGNESEGRTAKRFDTKENDESDNSPSLTVDFTDGNSAPTDITLDNNTVPEDADTSSAFPVGNLSAEDPDSGDTHTFSLVTGSGSDDNGLFQITGNRLELRPGTELDHETKDELSARVEATDQGGLSVQKSLTVQVTDVNEPPVLSQPIDDQFTTTGTSFELTLPEETFTDEDAGDTVTLSAALEDGSALPAWLAFDSSSRTFSGTPSADDAAIFTVQVMGTDQGDPPLEAIATFRMFVPLESSPWQNPENNLDVNADTFVSAAGDVLPMINELNEPEIIDSQGNLPVPPDPPSLPPPFLDPSGDNILSPVQDILPLINALNESVGGEGEASAQAGSRSLLEIGSNFPASSVQSTARSTTADSSRSPIDRLSPVFDPEAYFAEFGCRRRHLSLHDAACPVPLKLTFG